MAYEKAEQKKDEAEKRRAKDGTGVRVPGRADTVERRAVATEAAG